MDNSMSSMSNSANNNQTFSSEQSLNLSNSLPNVVSPQPNMQHPPPTTSSSNNPDNPVKRRPGRPKGSTKKNLLGEMPPPKMKRPVGRPRKDGFPAGSVGSTRSTRPKRSKTEVNWNPMSGVDYPVTAMYGASISAGSNSSFQIDPSLERDDWVELSRTNPNAFLSTLLTALAAPNPVSNAGPSVEEAFKSHLVSLAPNPSQMQPIPSLYSILKTFWLPSSPAYFSLTASASTARTPSEHHFLYWDPQPLVFNGISCPGCSAPLINKGRITTGPVKIYDIEKPFFIIGCEYICKSQQCVSATSAEGRKFASTDSSILRSLPVKLQDEFPARLLYSDTDAGSGPNIWNWKALGVSLSLWKMVHGCLSVGLKKEVILHLIRSIQHGVSGERGESKEEEEVVEEEDGDDETPQAPNGSSTSHGPNSENGGNPSFADAYSDAWKENTAVGDAANAAGNAGNLAQTSASGTPAHNSGPTGNFDFSKGTSYMNYPFAPYAYFPGNMVGSSMGHIAAGGALSTPRPQGANNVTSASPVAGHGASDSDSIAQDQQSKRSPRHCCKCGSQECKGKGGRSFCTNACQDCGKLDCKGRNSRRPEKKCTEGWS